MFSDCNSTMSMCRHLSGLNRKSALLNSARSGHGDCLLELISKGVDVNVYSKKGKTALMIAAAEGHVGCVQVLIQEGADLNLQEYWEENPDRTALMLATYFQHSECVNLLIQAGADVNIGGHNGGTALWHAACAEISSMTKMLIEAGAETDERTSLGYTALMNAARIFPVVHKENILMLIEAGADVNIVNTCGETALMLAAQRGYYKCIDLLTKYGCDLNKTCHSDKTSLLLAVCSTYEGMERLMRRTAEENERHLLHYEYVENELRILHDLLYKIYRDGIKCTKLLLKGGAEINVDKVPWNICVCNPVVKNFSSENKDQGKDQGNCTE